MDETTPRVCHYCGKPVPYGHNYCPRATEGEDCIIKHWRANGAKEHLPNGLPVRCLAAYPPPGLLLECEHGDHPDYMFPVDVDGPDEVAEGPNGETTTFPGGELHALIYTDRSIALTLYECEYHLFLLETGEEIARADRDWRVGKYRLDPDSLAKIKNLPRKPSPA